MDKLLKKTKISVNEKLSKFSRTRKLTKKKIIANTEVINETKPEQKERQYTQYSGLFLYTKI